MKNLINVINTYGLSLETYKTHKELLESYEKEMGHKGFQIGRDGKVDLELVRQSMFGEFQEIDGFTIKDVNAFKEKLKDKGVEMNVPDWVYEILGIGILKKYRNSGNLEIDFYWNANDKLLKSKIKKDVKYPEYQLKELFDKDLFEKTKSQILDEKRKLFNATVLIQINEEFSEALKEDVDSLIFNKMNRY